MLVHDYIQDEKLQQADLALEKLEPKDNEDYYFLLSYIQLKKRNLHDAEKNLQKTIAINPEFHEAYYNLAVVSLYNKKLEEAREYIQAALALDKNNPEYLLLWDKIKE
ncbi:tetratricopeptide repeat protein [Niallia circulans]|uniref:tetratricopeptide repeat protein n=1 Tax=Niallia circulans TaxID=1397 RepID=UPI0014905C9C|nr:tetratricopeptide repeat protein [Niallia circulans]